MIPTEQISLFDAYLNNELKEEDRIQFEKELLSNEEFSGSFSLYQESIIQIKSAAIKGRLGQIMADNSTKNTSNRFSFLKVAAVFLILISSVWAIYMFFDSKRDNLFNEYFDPYPIISLKRNNNVTEGLKGFVLYEKGKYQSAIKVWEEEQVKSDTTNFYLGISYLKTEKYSLAESAFNQIHESSIFSQHTLWYQAISKIAMKDTSGAMNLLERIEPGEYNYSEAMELKGLIGKLSAD